MGTTVAVGVPERFLLLGAALVYGVPLAALLAGGVGGAALFGSDAAAALGAAIAVVGVWLVAPLWRRKLENATLRELVVRPTETIP